jgi:hypothetical protein
LDFGLSELEFWEMTPGEVVRLANSRARVRRLEAQEKASYDYILANLIVQGVSITLGGKNQYPTINEAYPDLFDDMAKRKEAEIQQKKDNLSALRFRQFAQSYNNKFMKKEVPKTINE